MSASDFFAGKSARPKMIDLETKTVSSSSSAPIASAPSPVTPAPATPTPSEPSKSKSAPAAYVTPTPAKEEPKSAFKEEFTPDSTPAATPKISEPETIPEPEAKSLEIEQPESEDEQPQSQAGKTETAVKGIPAPSSNGEVAAPQNKLLVKKLSDAATTPTRGSALAAGYDLYAAEDKTVPARGKALVDLQLSIAVPGGTYGRVAPRSGLASKHSIHTGAGVIDADYRGPVMVLLFNLGEEDFSVKRGDRIAQLVLEKICLADIVETDNLEATARGAGGFGSTGGFGKV